MGLARPDYGNNERDERRNDGGRRCILCFYFAFHACIVYSFHVYLRDLSFPPFQMSIVDTLARRQ